MENTQNNSRIKSGLRTILEGVARWYHEDRAEGCRVASSNYHTAACALHSIDSEKRTRYLETAERFADKTNYHLERARQYRGGN